MSAQVPGSYAAKNAQPVCPPAKMANDPTETAAEIVRATLSSAVDHLPIALSNTSVALHAIPARTGIKKVRAQTATHKRLKIHIQKIATA
jgi:hypothetical protein